VTPTESGYWVEAKDLKVGDVFLGANGELSTLTNIVRIEQEGEIAVFNFSVEGNHNYFVLAKEYEYGQTCILVHNAKWYHGTNSDSATDILKNGLNEQRLMQNSLVRNKKGFYVSDDIGMAQSHADLMGKGKPGVVLEMKDKDIGHLLMGDATKNNEAFIPFKDFSQVKPDMIKMAK